MSSYWTEYRLLKLHYQCYFRNGYEQIRLCNDLRLYLIVDLDYLGTLYKWSSYVCRIDMRFLSVYYFPHIVWIVYAFYC
jgi:hypothetical protein